MGKSKSTASQAITNNTVNKNFMDSLNKTIMNSSVETLVNNASTCSSAVSQSNSCNMSGTKITGNFNFSGNQTNTAKVDFSCVQASTSAAQMATSMASTMAAEIKALNGTEAAAQLNTAAKSSNNTGFGATGGSSSSNSNVNDTNNVSNDTVSKVENIFQQNLSKHFTTNTVNECIGKTTQSNSQDLANMNIEGNAKVECVQANSLEQVQECKQMAEAISKTTQETFQELGIKSSVANTTASKTESTVSSTSESISTGPIQDLGNAISGILGSVTGLASLTAMGPSLSIVCSICCCIISICLIFVFMRMGGSEGSGSISENLANVASSAIQRPSISSLALNSTMNSTLDSAAGAAMNSGLSSAAGTASNFMNSISHSPGLAHMGLHHK